MKTKSKQSPYLQTITYLLLLILVTGYLLSMNNADRLHFNLRLTDELINDDTIPADEGEMTDTAGLVQETVIDGVDTVWYLGIDESENDIAEMKIGLLDSFITINLGNQKKVVQKNLFGFATAGIYSKNQMPNDTFALDQWQWTSDMQPQVLRFPGGAESKFMNVLNGPGYGWDIATIARYYDMTDSVRIHQHMRTF